MFVMVDCPCDFVCNGSEGSCCWGVSVSGLLNPSECNVRLSSDRAPIPIAHPIITPITTSSSFLEIFSDHANSKAIISIIVDPDSVIKSIKGDDCNIRSKYLILQIWSISPLSFIHHRSHEIAGAFVCGDHNNFRFRIINNLIIKVANPL